MSYQIVPIHMFKSHRQSASVCSNRITGREIVQAKVKEKHSYGEKGARTQIESTHTHTGKTSNKTMADKDKHDEAQIGPNL